MAKYIYRKTKDGNWYFRRRIPDDLKRHYPGKKAGEIIFSLQTRDADKAATLAHRKALEQDKLWANLRNGTVAESPEAFQSAQAILSAYGLKPGQAREYHRHDLEPNDFYDHLRYLADALHPETSRENWADDLPLDYKLASDIFHGKKVPVFLSEAFERDLELTGENRATGIGKDRARVINEFIQEHGDLPLDQYDRDMANAFVKYLLDKPNKTETVKRRLNSIRPVFNVMHRELGLADTKIFHDLIIPNLGNDAKKRLPFSNDEIKLFQAACREQDDEIRWLIAFLSDTGMRLGEAAGLRLDDVVLDTAIPHVLVRENDVRGVKTEAGERIVPLVGTSLWAAHRAVSVAKSQDMFPRYVNRSKSPPDFMSTHASNTINNWLRNFPIIQPRDKSTHSFRHAMQDRLREAGTPREIRKAICGWSKQDADERYGRGYSLAVLHEHIAKVVIEA